MTFLAFINRKLLKKRGCPIADTPYNTMPSIMFKEEFQEELEEFNVVGLKNQRKNIKVLDQTGKTTPSIDTKRKALAPGKRISKSGKVYWETRKNRSDVPGKKN